MNRPELLIPAGSLENLKIAVGYGADAVYVGGEAFGLRAKAKNFSLEEMKEGVAYAHAHGVKVYVTANIIAHNRDIEGVRVYLEELKDVGPDALIVADPGILMAAKEVLPGMELHLSTQANNTNHAALSFWHSQGVKRVVVARELSFAEIREIREKVPPTLDIEAFVHGAMCISYSGRCLLSNYMTGKDANQGACTHPCRWRYHLVEETRPGEYMPIEENERGTYIYNSKDLCLLEHIDDLMKAGVRSFKVEGRMKTGLYVATVTRAYRNAIDDYLKDPALYKRNIPKYMDEIVKCSHRPFTTGFFYERPDGSEQIYDNNNYIRDFTYVARVLSYNPATGRALVEQRNKFVVGDRVEVMKKDGRNLEVVVEAIWDEEGNPLEAAPHPKQRLYLPVPEAVEPNELLRAY
ncbi:peptidase U32 family protein [Anaerotalea alkaliphila]|nr:U32 family peptidase C-terminal domain-containing protein [Anaerotalea alkaliphila]